jgi:hypothetical protein
MKSVAGGVPVAAEELGCLRAVIVRVKADLHEPLRLRASATRIRE